MAKKKARTITKTGEVTEDYRQASFGHRVLAGPSYLVGMIAGGFRLAGAEASQRSRAFNRFKLSNAVAASMYILGPTLFLSALSLVAPPTAIAFLAAHVVPWVVAIWFPVALGADLVRSPSMMAGMRSGFREVADYPSPK